MLAQPTAAAFEQSPLSQPRLAPSRRRVQHSTGFCGVDLTIRWENSARELAGALQSTSADHLFVLRSISRGDVAVWRCDGAPDAITPLVAGPWNVRFDAAPGAEARAEVRLPRLLECVAARAAWVGVNKRFHARPEQEKNAA